MSETKQLLKSGIHALKAGEKEKARKLLMQVVKQDEENEQGWLWLSGAVKSKEECRICLENVLMLNPENEPAKKGLAKMGFSIPTPAPILVPEKPEEPTVDWSSPFYETELPEANDPNQKKFQDIWTSSAELCAYCAHPVVRTNNKCQKCGRKLIGKEYLTPRPNIFLVIWLVLRAILHLGQIGVLASLLFSIFGSLEFPILAFFSTGMLVIYAVYFLISITLSVGLYKRQNWAYWPLAFVVVLYIFPVLYFIFVVGEEFYLPYLLVQIGIYDVKPWMSIVIALPILFIQGLLIYAILKAGSGFKSVVQWRIASVSDRITDPLVMDKVANNYAKRKMWATAVLYWQRAVGVNPGNTAILRRLAGGYAKLGFYERSLDTLKLALEKARQPKVRQQISVQIAYLENQIQ